MNLFNTAINNRDSEVGSFTGSLDLGRALNQPLLKSQVYKEISKQIIKTIGDHVAYGGLEFFTKEKQSSASDFFKQIMYKVNLSQLYEIIDTCYYSKRMPYCPILVRDRQREKGSEDTKYLLQVWNKAGKLVFEKGLNHKPVSWCITNESLVYKPAPKDQNSDEEDCIQIVHLYRENVTVSVNIKALAEIASIKQPILGFCNKCLYIANENIIHIINVNQFSSDDDTSSQESAIYKVDLGGVVLHTLTILQDVDNTTEERDLPYLIICCETEQHQIDFAKFIYYPQQKRHEIEQISEVVQRNVKNDPIVKFKIVYDWSQMPYSISIRESGKVDFYWNYNLNKSDVHRHKHNYRFTDIELTFESFCLNAIEDVSQTQEVVRIDFNKNGRICIDDGVESLESELQVGSFKKLFQQRLNCTINFFHTFCLIGVSFLVAHNNKIFVYDITSNTVVLKFAFKSEVAKISRIEHKEGNYEAAVFMVDGTVNILENNNSNRQPSVHNNKEVHMHYNNPTWWRLKMIEKDGENFIETMQTHGRPKYFATNHEHQKFLYFIGQDENNQLDLQCFTKGRIYSFEEHHQNKLNHENYIFPMYNTKSGQDLVHYHKNYTHGMGKLRLLNVKEKLIEKNSNKSYSIKTQIERTISFPDDAIGNDIPHSAFCNNVDEVIILIGKRNIYRIDVAQQTTQVTKDVNIHSVQMLDNKYCYAIVQTISSDQKKRESGFKLFCLNDLIDRQILFFFDIEATVASRHHYVDFSEDNQRLIYMKNYEIAHIIPPLHRTTINFVGMLPRKRYLAVQKVREKFHALDCYSRITTWNALTGKLISTKKTANDYSQYLLYGLHKKKIKDYTYSKEWYQPKSLLISKNEAKNFINTNFLDKLNLSNQISGCKAYNDQDQNRFSFRNFKIIEIKNEDEVIEHMTFVHQYYQDQQFMQRLIISDDCKIMIEKLLNLRVLVYEQKVNDANGLTEWDLKTRFNEYPHELAEQSQGLYLFTPNLRRYLTCDKTDFIIKNTLPQETDRKEAVFSMSNYLNEGENVEEVVKRFKWVSNNKFLICSSWGFEKIIELKDDNSICEIGSSFTPAFNLCKKMKQIYFEPESLEIGDIQGRLMRKHRKLKRLRLICSKEEHNMMYEVLFSVDYNVNNGNGKYVSDISFSYIQLKLIEDIKACKINVKYLDDQLLKHLCLNILPGCKTILHGLTNLSQELQIILNRVPIFSDDYEMPFIQDLKNRTPLHYSIKKKDFKSADIFIKYLANAPIGHHSRDIIDILPEAIKNEIPSLLVYFDKRMLQTDQIDHITRGAIKKYSSNLEFGMMSSSPWEDSSLIRNTVFEQSKSKGNSTRFDTEVVLKFIDLPEYHMLSSKYCLEFFKALKETDNIELFELKSIRAMIEYMWPVAKLYTQRRLFYPFIGYLFSYWVYTNFLDTMRDMKQFEYGIIPWLINLIALVFFSLYFIINECRQIQDERSDYFKDPWNYIDLIPPIIILTIAGINAFDIQTDAEAVLMSIGSLLMWLKLLYFCRINKYTGYLIRMIVKVVFGMRTFLMVLLISISAVADASISIMDRSQDLTSQEDLSGYIWTVLERFFTALYNTYMMILGQGSLTAKEEFTFIQYMLTLFCTLFVMVVMLNLLISIIGDAFGKVQENQVNEYYQERASIIAENIYLIPKKIKEKECYKPGQLLLIAAKTGFSMQDEDGESQIDKDQRNQKEIIDSIDRLVSQKLAEFEKKFETQLSETGNHVANNQRETQIQSFMIQ